MAAWVDYYPANLPAEFGISAADAQWLADRLFELQSMTPSLVIDGAASENYKGVLWAEYAFHTPIRSYSLLASGDPINLLFGCKPSIPIFLRLQGGRLSWAAWEPSVLYREYMSGLTPADWPRVVREVTVWNPVLK